MSKMTIRFIYFQFTELKVFERVNTCTLRSGLSVRDMKYDRLFSEIFFFFFFFFYQAKYDQRCPANVRSRKLGMGLPGHI